MALQLAAVRFDAAAPRAQALFWAGLLDREVDAAPGDGVATARARGTAVALRFVAAPEPKKGRNRMHFDLTSRSHEDQDRLVARALELGGGHYDVGQRGDEGHVVLADPEGDEFCVIEPENMFLAGCGQIGALNCEGLRASGLFWSKALGWPLVWDQDEETAIQSPEGGAKVTWSGPPLFDKPPSGRNRLRIELVATDGADRDEEAARLVALGARMISAEPDALGTLTLADPDDNEFHLG
ncbi:VOC family protein [Xylanimonas sp. McL0601]|uniref:VOC family protein n=1 Tax=Xylanimonas sp. McL0601 TaxID=3414739 RepID=UPI003CEF5C59